jgi:hypothetical protein
MFDSCARRMHVTLVYTFNFLLIIRITKFYGKKETFGSELRGAQTCFQLWKHIKILLVMNSFTFIDVISHLIMSS